MGPSDIAWFTTSLGSSSCSSSSSDAQKSEPLCHKSLDVAIYTSRGFVYEMIVACIIRKINFYSVPSGSHARVGNRGRGVYANFKIVFMRTVEKKQKGANRIKTGTFAVVSKLEVAKTKSPKVFKP
uniref:tRNA pseudouridine synthase n=1 Tax=Mesocestoides corti TaxID=53468 RepID=A0A5K3FN14_MESCO